MTRAGRTLLSRQMRILKSPRPRDDKLTLFSATHAMKISAEETCERCGPRGLEPRIFD
jgi:hypothetical protein